MSAMNISVHSSFIKSAVYNETKQTLRIEIGNYWYYFYGVTKQKINRFKKSASKGSYFCRYIKDKYETVKRKAR